MAGSHRLERMTHLFPIKVIYGADDLAMRMVTSMFAQPTSAGKRLAEASMAAMQRALDRLAA
jgi:hypothetical protein